MARPRKPDGVELFDRPAAAFFRVMARASRKHSLGVTCPVPCALRRRKAPRPCCPMPRRPSATHWVVDVNEVGCPCSSAKHDVLHQTPWALPVQAVKLKFARGCVPAWAGRSHAGRKVAARTAGESGRRPARSKIAWRGGHPGPETVMPGPLGGQTINRFPVP